MELHNNNCGGKTEQFDCPSCRGKGILRMAFYKNEDNQLKSMEEIVDKAHYFDQQLEEDNIRWIFRGQGRLDWPLKTSLERFFEIYNLQFKNAREAEELLCREFKRKYHQYSLNIPKEDDYLEWFSIMRHYMAPTRLLDFNYSFLIAAYFALEFAEGDCAVWAINSNWAINSSKRLFNYPAKSFFEQQINEKTNKLFGSIFMKRPKKFACPVNPFQLNERLTMQKGLFMCPGDVTVSFMDNLRAMTCYNENTAIKVFIIELSKKERMRALRSFYNMNVNRAVLFPDLSGFAESLGITPPVKLLPESPKLKDYMNYLGVF